MRRLIKHLCTFDLARVMGFAFLTSPSRALEAAYWYVTKRRVRGINLAFALATHHRGYYRLWVKAWEPTLIGRLIAEWKTRTTETKGNPAKFIFLILGDAASTPAQIAFTQSSIVASFGPATRIVIVSGDSALSFAHLTVTAHASDTEWLVILGAGDAVHYCAKGLLPLADARTAASMVYWDEDRLVNGGRSDPFLKPDWDELLFLGRDILSGSAAFRMSAVMAAVPSLTDAELKPQRIAELAIALASAADIPPIHVPAILSHRHRPDFFDQHESWRRSALDRHWATPVILRDGEPGDPVRFPAFPLSGPAPSISIIIPTRDKKDLLQTCLEGLARTVYPSRLEIIVVDNGSSEPDTLAYLDQIAGEGIHVHRDPGPFNFSRLNNAAADIATGEYLCLLNNDIEIIDDRWLLTMAENAVQPGIGAVGALLLYPDATIQHAGVAIGVGGAAGHVHRGISPADEANGSLHRYTRQVSAVTAACMLVRHDIFSGVGGLDEKEFAVAFNDVDLCLKIGATGLKNIFVGNAVLIHHESKSRGSDMDPANADRFARELGALKQRWHTESFEDPYHHPLLLLTAERYALAPA